MANLQNRKSDQYSQQSLCVRADHRRQISVSVSRRTETYGHICLHSPEPNAVKEGNQRLALV